MKITGKTLTATAVLLAAAISSGTLYASGVFSGNKAAEFAQSRISATQAVEAAQSETGGRAVEVGFKHKNSQSYYEVEVLTANEAREVRVDAASGKVLDSKVEKDSDGKAQVQAGITLQQAIAAAEAKTQGRAKEADLKEKNGQTVYEVETVAGNQKYETRVNAADGSILSSQTDS